jgi:hypothetical protein
MRRLTTWTATLNTENGRKISAIQILTRFSFCSLQTSRVAPPSAETLEVAAMGMVTGWIAVRGMERRRMLEALGLEEAPGAPKPKASICDLPNGWSVLFTSDFRFPTPERLALLSAEGTAIAVSAEEHVMVIAIRGYEGGQAVFAIEHDGGQGVRHIAAAGKVPAEWAAILDQANREQDEDDQSADVDHLFDAPLALAEALCGYRHDTAPEDLQMTPLVPKKGPGLIGRLFGSRA